MEIIRKLYLLEVVAAVSDAPATGNVCISEMSKIVKFGCCQVGYHFIRLMFHLFWCFESFFVLFCLQ